MNKPDLPENICFADELSEANYHIAIGEQKHFFKRMIVICSNRPASGKTRLARHILHKMLGEQPAVHMQPQSEREWSRVLPLANAQKYLFLDNVSGHIGNISEHISSDTLASFLTSKKWQYRPSGKSELVTIDVDIQVVLTGNNITMSPELMRRSIIIELK